MRDESQPSYGQVWEYQGHEVFILGNCASDDGKTIWASNRQTGKRMDAVIKELIPTSVTGKDTLGELTGKCVEWAKAGNADAAWWLGWRMDGENHPKSMWYYLAAIRMNPNAYSWYLSNLHDNGKFGAMCSGVTQPDINYMREIPEFIGQGISSNWLQAIAGAEAAIHKPATASQLERAMEFLATGVECERAAWDAGLTRQGLTLTGQYKAWRVQSDATQRRLNDVNHAGFHSLDGPNARPENTPCPHAVGTEESAEWLRGQSQAQVAWDEFS